MKEMYQLTAAQVMNHFGSSAQGLSSAQAAEHRHTSGWNELISAKAKPLWRIFLEQFQDFLVIILIIAAIISGLLGDAESAAVILVVITLNAILGTIQTRQAERSLTSLKNLSAPKASVLRDGTVMQLPARDLVPGDIVLLEAGDIVPADGRIIECAGFKIDESALTGESLSSDKIIDAISEQTALGDRRNMVFSGSFITNGRGKIVITDIGMHTEVGKIAKLLHHTSAKRTPLQTSLDSFGKKLSITILLFCGILFGISVFRGESIENAFLFAVALAVAAIPEALSSIVTIVLSFGTQKMAREHAIIRKLQAVEGLGSISVICSDKTGTLTQNKMTVEHYYVNGKTIPVKDVMPSNTAHKLLYFASVLCNDAKIEKENAGIGDPTEIALLQMEHQMHISISEIQANCPRIDELPFDSDRKMMATLHTCPKAEHTLAEHILYTEKDHILIVKGAVDVLLQRTDAVWTENGIIPFDKAEQNRIQKQNQAYSAQGLRVLAFAYRELSAIDKLTFDHEKHLTFLGLIAMMDPPRPESKEAVATCIRAGIRPVMITGDHILTASAIAERIGILTPDTKACEGAILDTMSDEELQELVPKISVYARVSPEHKIRIVRAWQARGHVVAMTGDGVNDAPALKQADIGVAMGGAGTEVAKDAADMVLTDDNFSTIVSAVKNGRNLYQNILHAIEFLLSGNLGAILTVLVASLAGLPVPFAPVHLLFINLLTDSLPAIALGLEPHTADVMNKQPRDASSSILTGHFLKKISIEGLVIGAVTTGSFLTGLQQGNAILASTCAFGTLCLARLFHGFNCKSEKPVLFTEKMWHNKWLLGAFVLGAVLITGVLTLPGLQNLFKVQTLTMPQLGMVYLYAFLSLPIIQFLKWIKRKREA
ncbi:cation-translocating P-type ATPase [uncultured Eubacterium sp.]|uniref:cation-translocating P-type ATPase n=1 Tax=uncultured Eubacterium sp. TaxID=165185 RepID=UPI0025F453B9|nr:cation-translocating P-type ATPase [uncultured Eubacterium sp.]